MSLSQSKILTMPLHTMSTRQPLLHIVTLHESPVQDGDNYERFDHRWILQDSENRVATGDLLVLPDLLTGAGECEGFRMVGLKMKDGWELLPCGVEYPEFPDVVVRAAGDRSLRGLYEELINQGFVKSDCGVESLEDIMGGSDEVDEFWRSPPSVLVKDEKRGNWIIPLKDCRRFETVST